MLEQQKIIIVLCDDWKKYSVAQEFNGFSQGLWRGLGWGEVIPLPLVLLTPRMWCSVTQDQGLIRFGFQQTDKERFWACPNVTVEVIFREPVRAGDLAFCSKLHISEWLTFLILVIDSATSAEGIIPMSAWTGLLHLALQRAKEISCLILQKLFIFTGEKWLRQSDERRIVNFCGFFLWENTSQFLCCIRLRCMSGSHWVIYVHALHLSQKWADLQSLRLHGWRKHL